MSKIEKWCRRAEEIRDRCKKEGKKFTARDITRSISAIEKAHEAQAVMLFTSLENEKETGGQDWPPVYPHLA